MLSRIRAIIGVRSNIPSGGMTRRIGPSSGSVIWCSNWLIVVIIGLVAPITSTHDMIILPRIASQSAVKKRELKLKKKNIQYLL